MNQVQVLTEALRPQVRELARELAPIIHREAWRDLAPGNYQALAVLYLDGIFMRELRQALEEQ